LYIFRREIGKTGFLPDNLVASRQNLGHSARHIQLQQKRPQSKKIKKCSDFFTPFHKKDSFRFLFYFYLVLIWKRWTRAVPAWASHTPSPAPSIHTTALQAKFFLQR
jgi:hypothetical protein